VALTSSAINSDYKGYTIQRSSDYTVTYGTVEKLFNNADGSDVNSWVAGWNGTSGTYDAGTGEHSGTYHTPGSNNVEGTGAALFTGAPDGEWVSLQIPNGIKLDHVKIRARDHNDGVEQYPKDFEFWGSNNGTDWSLIKSFTNQSWPGQNNKGSYHVNSNISYNRIAMIITKIPINVQYGTHCVFGQLEYYGYEEGSGSLDTTLKTVYNVPATTGTQLEVYYDGRETSSYSGSGTTVTDISPNTNNGTLGTGVGFDATYKAFTFNGATTASISGTHGLGSGSIGAHSFSYWLKRTSQVDAYEYHAMIGTGGNTGGQTAIGINQDKILIAHNGGTVTSEKNVITDNTWIHVAVNYNGGTTNLPENHNLYINGIEQSLIGSGSGGNFSLVGNELTLGRFADGGNGITGSIANFRLYSKALNADQVKELYDFQKDYFLGSKSQVTLYKGHLGVGVTEPSGQLELAGDERIQEYPPRALRQYTTHVEGHGVFTVRASAELNQTGDNDRAWKLFTKIADNSNYWTPTGGTTTYGYSSSDGYTTAYHETAGVKGHWVQLQLPYKIKLHSVKIAAGISTRQAKDATVFGSNDGGNTWTSVGGWTDNNVDDFTLVTFSMNNVGYYSLYRLVITRNGGNDATTLSELQFFGTPGPTTLDKGSLTLGRSLDVPRVSRYDVDTETPRPEKLLVDFDTTVNSSPTDISGQGNHGVYHGSTSYVAADKAFDSPNHSGILIRDSSLGSGTQPLTLCAWAKGGASGGETWNADANDCIIGVGPNSSSGHSSFQLCVNTDAITLDMASASNFVEYPVTIENYRWYFFAMTYSGGDAFTNTRVYLDGVEIAKPSSWTNGSSGTLSLPSSPDIGVGTRTGNGSSDTPAGFLGGMISNPKVYNVALEPSEVRKLYNLGRTGRSMVISDTAVGIGKAPEAQLDVRGILKASVGLFPDRPSFMCPVALFGAKAIPTSTTMYDYSTRDGLTLANRGVGTSTMRWKLGDNGGRHTNTMYPTNNVKLVRVFDDTTSETSGVQVPYEGYYLCHNFVRSPAGGYNMGNSFITYSESQQKYITASINAYMLPWGGGHSGQSTDYMMQFVSAVLYLRPNDKVIFSFWNQTSYSGGFEQYVSLVML